MVCNVDLIYIAGSATPQRRSEDDQDQVADDETIMQETKGKAGGSRDVDRRQNHTAGDIWRDSSCSDSIRLTLLLCLDGKNKTSKWDASQGNIIMVLILT